MEDRIVVGGGIAGSMAATTLARRGLPILLLERSRGPHHKVCGEFLSWEASDRLSAVGFDVAALGGARIDRVRLYHGTRSASADLPRSATGISRFRLDEALLEHAGRAGVKIERGVAVNSVHPFEAGLALDVGGERLNARTLFLATGKTDLRGLGRDSGRMSNLVGFKSHYRLDSRQTAALTGAVELHLFEGGYAGLQLVEGDTANLCLLIERDRVANTRGSWDRILGEILASAPILGDRLEKGEMLFDRPLTVSSIPYGFLYNPAPHDPPGIMRLGDQFAVLHSFTGEGMALATASGGILAGAEAQGRSDPTYLHHQFRKEVIRPLLLSAVMHHLIRQTYGRLLIRFLAGSFPGILATSARFTRVGY